MEKFELWIDESGDFNDDVEVTTGRKDPSLVGGVLVRNNYIDYDKATKILGKTNPKGNVHFTEQKNKQKALDVLKKCLKCKAQFVVFQNLEKLRVVGNNVTYLTVCAEGIAQLYHKLLAEYGDFDLKIVIATRKNMDVNRGIIQGEEYNRLKERIILEMARRGVYNDRLRKWLEDYTKIEFADARYDSRLQLSDCVCNTFLTQHAKKKFNDYQRDEIKEIFSDSNYYYFTVITRNISDDIDNMIIKNNYAQALFAIYFEKEFLDAIFDVDLFLNKTIKSLSFHKGDFISSQLSIFSNSIGVYFKYVKDNPKLRDVIEHIQLVLISMLKENNIIDNVFNFDIALYLYTTLTHLGSEKGVEQYKKCLEYLDGINDVFLKTKYYCMLANRRAIDLKNMFEYEGSLKAINSVVKINEEMMQALSLVEGFPQVENTLLRNEELAKAYGTRLQMWPLLWDLNNDEEYVLKAQHDYENALENFSKDIDKARQYLYMAQMQVICGKFNDALMLLGKTENVDFRENDALDKFLEILQGRRFSDVKYQYLMYFKIMFYARIAKDESSNKLADKMDKAFKSHQHKEIFPNGDTYDNNIYPQNMICWFYAEYLKAAAKNGAVKESNKYYDKALLASKRVKDVDLTIQFINMGILASKILANPSNCQLELDEYNAIKGKYYEVLGVEGSKYWQCIKDDNFEELSRRAKLIS